MHPLSEKDPDLFAYILADGVSTDGSTDYVYLSVVQDTLARQLGITDPEEVLHATLFFVRYALRNRWVNLGFYRNVDYPNEGGTIVVRSDADAAFCIAEIERALRALGRPLEPVEVAELYPTPEGAKYVLTDLRAAAINPPPQVPLR